ncbi:MAG TPA: glutamine-hydrolyzing GMP synthase [Thermoanaerobaculaceae bacterium]|nr:glutamine-hydrolyzing GMP synthase [Thermoanaerobaculaceae bacterium]HRS15965.1 glutamine-hydrolyzing GMP synthase [Thermoanaerobaculaceae bacterium]
MMHETLLILDFGSQYTQLIARRVREAGVFSEIRRGDLSAAELARLQPVGIVLSGGPASVYEEGAIRPDPAVFEQGVPVLGICYGLQAMALVLGGQVEAAGGREYGAAELAARLDCPLFAGTTPSQKVWMSHGDKVTRLPEGFAVVGHTASAPLAAIADAGRRLYGIQFHPEVRHTDHGRRILDNFLDICGARRDWTPASIHHEAVARIREKVGDGRIVVGLSGGVDSSVTALLCREAVGDRTVPIFVDTGLLRLDEGDKVERRFASFGLRIDRVNAAERFFARLAGIEDPEEKRRRIGHEFIAVFEEEARRFPDARFLAQGTLYPDVIESTSVRGPSATIKTHHNVGGLPERLGLALVEPLRDLFKDEVRRLGLELGLPEEFVWRHPFPGPGLAVRILGEVTPERVALLQRADAIFMDEIREAGLYRAIAQALTVLLPVRSVGVMGDQRTYENVAALRAVTTEDFMTADWFRFPSEVLDRVARRMVNEVRGINRVVYDVTSKPPGTIEWE